MKAGDQIQQKWHWYHQAHPAFNLIFIGRLRRFLVMMRKYRVLAVFKGEDITNANL